MRFMRTAIPLLLLLTAFQLMAQGLEPTTEWQEKKNGWQAELYYDLSAHDINTLTISNFPGKVSLNSSTQKREIKISFHSTRNIKINAINDLNTYLPEINLNEGKLTFDSKNNLNSIMFSEAAYKMELLLPAEINIVASSKDGDIEISNTRGNVEIAVFGFQAKLNNISGKMTLHASNGDIFLNNTQGTVTANLFLSDLTSQKTHGNISLKATMGIVELKGGEGNLDVNLDGGDLQVKHFDMEYLNILATVGGIHLDKVVIDSSFTINAAAGDVYINNCSGNLDLVSKSGMVEVNKLDGYLKLEKLAGNIKLNEISGDASAKTITGDIYYRMAKSKNSQVSSISVSTDNGDITMNLPPDLPFTYNAYLKKNMSGLNIVSDFSLELNRYPSGLKGTGDNYGGGIPVHMETGMGNIEIKKSKSGLKAFFSKISPF